MKGKKWRLGERNDGFRSGGFVGIEIDSLMQIYRKKLDRDNIKELLDTEESTIRYQNVILGIERRWDALMKRRSEPKRKIWQIEVIGDIPNN